MTIIGAHAWVEQPDGSVTWRGAPPPLRPPFRKGQHVTCSRPLTKVTRRQDYVLPAGTGLVVIVPDTEALGWCSVAPVPTTGPASVPTLHLWRVATRDLEPTE